MLRGGKASLTELTHINSYVLVLLQYCLWFYLVYLGGRYYGKRTLNILLILGVAVSSFVMYFCFDAKGWCYERWGLVWGSMLFLFLPHAKALFKPQVWKILTFGLLSLVLGVAYLKFKPVFFYGEFLLKIVLGIVIITLLFTLSSQRKFGNRAINFLGDVSYEVYLSHHFIMLILASQWPELPSGLFVVLTVVGTVAFSAVIHYIGKPVIKFLRA